MEGPTIVTGASSPGKGAAADRGPAAGRRHAFVRGTVLGTLLCTWAVAAFLTPRFPSQDGPAHMATARLILELVRNHAWGAAAGYVRLAPRLVPNWFEAAVLPGLVALLGASPAEKLFAVGSVLAFAGGLWFALGAVRTENRFLVALGLPFAFNVFLAGGFFNYCYGVASYLFVVGHWVRYGSERRWAIPAVTAVLLVVLFFIHLVPLTAALVTMGCVTLAEVLFSSRRNPGALVRLLVSGLPAVVLAGAFLLSESQRPGLPPTAWTGRIRRLALGDVLVSHHPWEVLFATGAVFLLALCCLFAVRGRGRNAASREDGLVVATVVLVAAYLGVPDSLPGGGLISERLLIFPYLTLLLWLSTRQFSRSMRLAVEAGGVVVTLGLIASQAMAFRELAPSIREYLSVEARLPSGSTLVPIAFGLNGRDGDGNGISLRAGVFAHASGWFTADRPVLTLENYEAPTGHFPIAFRSAVDPYGEFWPTLKTDPARAFDRYNASSGGIDYVLVWDAEAARPYNAHVRDLLVAVGERYHVVFRSSGGRAVLYEREGLRQRSPSEHLLLDARPGRRHN